MPPTEGQEADWVANMILDLVDEGARFREIAVLVRGRAAYPRLVEQFGIGDLTKSPHRPGGSTRRVMVEATCTL